LGSHWERRSRRNASPVAEATGPDDGLKFSRRSWLLVAVEFGFLGSLGGAVGIGSILGLRGGLIGGLLGGVAVGIAYGLDYGGGYVVWQWRRRRDLARGGCLPSDLVPFLNWAAERKILRVVGGGYEFCHLTLRDLLSERSADAQEPPTANLE
jgi:hypothetical protein